MSPSKRKSDIPETISRIVLKLLAKTVESEINIQTFKFLMILVNRDRIFLYDAIANYYLKLVYIFANTMNTMGFNFWLFVKRSSILDCWFLRYKS